MDHHAWHIIGGDDVAQHLRGSTSYVPVAESVTVVTDAATIPAGAIATARAVIVENADLIVPHLLGFRAVEEVSRKVHAGEAGQIYGCFGSFRLPRGTDSANVALDGLLPLLTVALEVIEGSVSRVWAHTASLLADTDAWFVTLRINEMIVTLEALATANPSGSTELLIEITGSEKVLRAEPTRQAVTIAPFDAPVQAIGWWEDAGERFLQRLTRMETEPMFGTASRLRTVWSAIQESADSGAPVTLT